ncbi:N-(5'-phosphoribosyl)anthranilate isomerase [Megasphaera sp. ASD88]|uniref:phosphoribosylanthranilate isomerase n=1 Tax=Megasphaera sp. ASD88 TaxID=2027407 RepID=UPI000BAB78F5|nr:phosphoribosylanthranilate isomerase [Megasphaera sp. ASD88]PAV38591.1 N-(5'-phosphoribosyl)anthranilate isomerase [Megasphaera sp. ASD88]
MVKIKLCGLTRRCDIEWANELLPDYVGFVFAGSRRRVTDGQAAQLRKILREDIPAVGVFVDEPIDHVAALVRQGVIQMVQLHGTEDEGFIRELRRAVSVPVIQAFSVRSPEDIQDAGKSSADFILLDHGAGGTGQAFDWSLAAALDRPYFLAGGLHPGNAAVAAELRPYAVDVSSGIETEGVKDRQKMIEFVRRIRHTF